MSNIEIKLDELKKLLYNAHMAGQGVEKGVAWELAEKYAEQQVKKLGLHVVGVSASHIPITCMSDDICIACGKKRDEH